MIENFYDLQQKRRKMQFKDLKTKKNECVLLAIKAFCKQIFADC